MSIEVQVPLLNFLREPGVPGGQSLAQKERVEPGDDPTLLIRQVFQRPFADLQEATDLLAVL